MEDLVEQPSVKQIAMKWGLILGVVSILFFIIITLTETDTSPGVAWLGIIPTIVVLFFST